MTKRLRWLRRLCFSHARPAHFMILTVTKNKLNFLSDSMPPGSCSVWLFCCSCLKMSSMCFSCAEIKYLSVDGKTGPTIASLKMIQLSTVDASSSCSFFPVLNKLYSCHIWFCAIFWSRCIYLELIFEFRTCHQMTPSKVKVLESEKSQMLSDSPSSKLVLRKAFAWGICPHGILFKSKSNPSLLLPTKSI